MLSLGSPRWSELQTAYGSASKIPALLQQLEKLPSDEGQSEPWFSLWSALAHQGDVYPASFAAVPHVVKALASSPSTAGAVYFHFPVWVEVCRQKAGIVVPPDLADAYGAALAQLPRLVAAAADRDWNDALLSCALAAIAASKGRPSLAEAVLELNEERAGQYLEWLHEQ